MTERKNLFVLEFVGGVTSEAATRSVDCLISSGREVWPTGGYRQLPNSRSESTTQSSAQLTCLSPGSSGTTAPERLAPARGGVSAF